jgi:tRNA A-37 threonylcarbamoyl transferase component Bud32
LREARQLDVAVARAAGKLIGQLHANGFSHTDLKETNLIWDAAGRVYVLDLDSLDYWEELPAERARADLRRLADGVAKFPLVTDQHRAAFLTAYAETRGLAEPPRC